MFKISVKKHRRNVNGRAVNVRKHYRRAQRYWNKAQSEVEMMLDDKDKEDTNITEFLQLTEAGTLTDISTLNDKGSGKGTETDSTGNEEIEEHGLDSGGSRQETNGDDL